MTPTLHAFERAGLFGLAALIVALIAQRLLDGRAPAAWRVWVWRVAMLQTALALLPLAPLRFKVLPPQPIESQRMSADKSFAPVIVPSVTIPPVTITPKALPAIPSQPQLAPPVTPTIEVASTRAAFSVAPSTMAAVIYGLGVALQCVTLIGFHLRLRRALRSCSASTSAAASDSLSDAARRMGLRRAPRLVSGPIPAPFLAGVLRPVIALPTGWLAGDASTLDASTLDASTLDAVFCHELAHLKRRDLTWNALLWAIQTLFWFHPLTWVARRYLALETESACDEMVLRQSRIAPKFYGELLMNTTRTPATPLAVGVSDGYHALKTRLTRLNLTPQKPRLKTRIAFAAALCLALGAALPLRFEARAIAQDSPATPAASDRAVFGVVMSSDGQPVAGARVYAWDVENTRRGPLEMVSTSSDGRYRFSDQLGARSFVMLFAQSPQGEMGDQSCFTWRRQPRHSTLLKLKASTKARLRFLDPQGRPAANLKVQLWRLGQSQTSLWFIPPSVFQQQVGTTDANGVATFSGLPVGRLAQFRLSDEKIINSGSGLGDKRGGRFAPLTVGDEVRLQAPLTTKTISLKAPLTLSGRASLGIGGPPATGAYIWARRVTPAEMRGVRGEAIERLIAGGRADAQGRFTLAGLYPGKYWVWMGEGKWGKEWVAPSLLRDFNGSVGHIDLAMTHGAQVEGTVISQATQQPVRGQTMYLTDFNGSNFACQTDAKGTYHFRINPGKTELRVHANGTNSPPPGYGLPAVSKVNFIIKNDEVRRFNFELPGRPVTGPVTGVVLGPDGQPAAGAKVWISSLRGFRRSSQFVTTDAEGRFPLSAKQLKSPLRLWAESGELTTSAATIITSSLVTSSQPLHLQLQAGQWASLEGTVSNEKGKPIPNASVEMSLFGGNMAQRAGKSSTDADGRFRFEHLRPGSSLMVVVFIKGYEEVGYTEANLRAGEVRQMQPFKLRAMDATLSGVVLQSDGKPAPWFSLSASSATVRANATGHFLFPRVVSGPMRVDVSGGSRHWGPFTARGNDHHVKIQLTPDREFKPRGPDMAARRIQQAALVGKLAPDLQVTQWVGSPPVSLAALRGQLVLLGFGNFALGAAAPLQDFASLSGGKATAIGIQPDGLGRAHPYALQTIESLGQELPFRIALDTPDSKVPLSGGRTAAAYGGASLVLIGKDGRVLYAGDDFERVVQLAAG